MSLDDTIAIQRTINLYSLAMDTHRWDLFDEIFTEDVIAEYNENTKWTDRASFKRDFATNYTVPPDSVQHTMNNVVVDVYGDTAYAVTYGHWRVVRDKIPGGSFWEGQGWYDDTIVRTPEGWRIKHRICKIIWWGGNPRLNRSEHSVAFDLPVTSLRAAADASGVSYLKARGMR